MGIMLAWPSSTILLFKSENTTLQRPMSETEIALLGSLQSVGSLTGNPIGAFLLDRLGRKYTSILSSLIYVIAWSLIAITDQVEVILMTMVLGGLGTSVFIEVSIYIGEIVQDSIRGTMTACPNLFYCLGFLVSYFLGGALDYHTMVYACLTFAVAGVLMIAGLKESPVTLMAKGRESDAAKSIAFYRSINPSAMEVINELANIRRSLNPDADDTQPLKRLKPPKEAEIVSNKVSCWQFFKSTVSTRRQFYLVLILNITYICQGLPVVQVYAEPIFTKTVGDFMSPNLCSVILGVVVLISGIIAAYLTDVVGRRPLQIYSSIAAGVCCVVIGTELTVQLLPKWTILVFMYAYAVLHTVGAGTVPFVMLAEVFLPEVKSMLTMLVIESACICLFLYLFLFNIVIEAVGVAPIFFFFSLVCFAASTYFFIFLPETKGLPVYAIQDLFITKKVNSKK